MAQQRDTDITRITDAYNVLNPRQGTFSFDVAAVARIAIESRDREETLRNTVAQLTAAVAEYLVSGTAEQRSRLEALARSDEPADPPDAAI